jgi:hypothetical protein
MLSEERISSWWWLIVVDVFRCYRIVETWAVKTETTDSELTRRPPRARSGSRFPVLQMNCAAADRAFEIAIRILQKRWKEDDFKNIRVNINKVLTNEQEQAIRNYIERLDKINMCVRFKMIVKTANFLVRSKNLTMSHQWFKHFIKRNSQLLARKQKLLISNRKNNHNLQDMNEYFSKLSRIMREKRITDDDVWNINETSFRIDCERTQLVIILNTRKSLRMTNLDNRDYILCVECISSDDEMIFSLIILIEMHILHKWCEKNDLNEETLIEISETNYLNDDLIMNWLHHFIQHTQSKRNEVWLLLVIDEFDSHSIISFFELITINNIVLFCLSTHSIHLTQSLNVKIF